MDYELISQIVFAVLIGVAWFYFLKRDRKEKDKLDDGLKKTQAQLQTQQTTSLGELSSTLPQVQLSLRDHAGESDVIIKETSILCTGSTHQEAIENLKRILEISRGENETSTAK